jgi:hypothetical protein
MSENLWCVNLWCCEPVVNLLYSWYTVVMCVLYGWYTVIVCCTVDILLFCVCYTVDIPLLYVCCTVDIPLLCVCCIVDILLSVLLVLSVSQSVVSQSVSCQSVSQLSVSCQSVVIVVWPEGCLLQSQWSVVMLFVYCFQWFCHLRCHGRVEPAPGWGVLKWPGGWFSY